MRGTRFTPVMGLLTLVAWVAGCTTLSGAFADDALDALQARIIRVSEAVTPAVVHVEAVVRQNNRRNIVTGSGFMIKPEGIALTNHHVVERAEKVTVRVPGRAGRYTAEVLGTDKQTDLAVLRVHARQDGEDFPVTKLGDSDALQVGEWVIAIGNPYGLDGTVSLGIVSAKGRDLESEQLLNDFIQTDAMIDRGSSGGPLVDLEGAVIGINSRGQGRGIGFTIPINTAKRVADDLLGEGGIARGYLGIVIQPLDRELATYWGVSEVDGVVINGVVEDSPAQKAGFQIGDIVTEFNGEPVAAEKEEDLGDFQRRVATSPVGQKVEIAVYRKGATEVLTAELGTQPKVVPDEEETPYGFTVQEVTVGLHRLHRLETREGVLVSFVERGSEGAEAGLAVGDLIQSVNDGAVVDLATFREAMAEIDGTQPFLVRAARGPNTRFLLLVPRGSKEGKPEPRRNGPADSS
jgi:S1-C subfamily serine protease